MATLQQVIHAHPAIAALRQNYPAAADALNAQPTIANPMPQGTIPRPLSLTDVFGVIAQLPNGAAEMAKLGKLPQWAYDGGVEAMRERADGSMTNWLQTIAAICQFDPATVTAMLAAKTQLLAATIPDPNYQVTVPGDAITDAPITANDVQPADQVSGGLWYRGAA